MRSLRYRTHLATLTRGFTLEIEGSKNRSAVTGAQNGTLPSLPVLAKWLPVNTPLALAYLAPAWRRFARRHVRVSMALARRRVAAGAGAILLALFALFFAKAADVAQNLFRITAAAAPLAPLFLTPAMFIAVAVATGRWVPEARGSGIPQVIAAARRPTSRRGSSLASLPVGFTKLLFTVLVLLAGGSVGREGPTVQLSAGLMVFTHRLLRVPLTAGVLIAGGAAGVAAAFNTPLAGVAFAIEELAAAYEQRVALLVMGAVMISGLTTIAIAGDYIYFGTLHGSLSWRPTLLIAPTVGTAGGLAGGLFTRCVLGFANARHGWVAKAKHHPVALAGFCGAGVALLGLVSGGSTWGTGYLPARHLIEGGSLSAWFGLEKLLASLLTTLSGVPGGIFAPSLSVGAGLGNVLAPLFPATSSSTIVLLGMTAYFVGVIRAPLTAIIILTETTASRGMILPLFATALIADGVSALVSRERLYVGLSRTFDQGRDKPSGAQQHTR